MKSIWQASNKNYEIVNPPTCGRESPRGEKFIYVMMYGIPDAPSLPFYVGQTDNLQRRFSNHMALMWHRAKFSVPAKIYIASTVYSENADLSEQDMIHKLSRAGHLLINESIANRREHRRQKFSNLLDLPADSIKKSLLIKKDIRSKNVLGEWKDIWSVSGSITSMGHQITKSQMLSYVSGLEYESNRMEELSKMIADSHSKANGLSLVRLSKSDSNELVYLRSVWETNAASSRKSKILMMNRNHLKSILKIRELE